jgi:hypothetical protein
VPSPVAQEVTSDDCFIVGTYSCVRIENEQSCQCRIYNNGRSAQCYRLRARSTAPDQHDYVFLYLILVLLLLFGFLFGSLRLAKLRKSPLDGPLCRIAGAGVRSALFLLLFGYFHPQFSLG